VKRDRAPTRVGLGGGTLVVPPETVSPSHRLHAGEGEPAAGVGRRAPASEVTGAKPTGTLPGHSAHDAGARQHVAWSKTRWSAAVSATRHGRKRMAMEQPFGDEIAFFAARGNRRHVQAGATLVHRGTPMNEVHMIERGAVAVVADQGDRRPILAFAVRHELCCAIPALLHEAAPWNAVAVTETAVIAVPAEVFTAAVHEHWVDRWATRTMTWLAEVGARVADLDEPEPAAQVAALLLRLRAEVSTELCRRTIADLLDLDAATVRDVLRRLELVGAVQTSGGRISVARPEILRDVVAQRGEQRHSVRF
jgi:CRP-like cAMP-binding protein